MKRNLILLSIVLFTTMQVWSQDASNFKFGLSLAPSYSWYSPDSKELTNNGGKVGFSYGFIADYYFADNYALSTGIQLDNSSGKLAYTPNTWSYIRPGDTSAFFLNSRNYKTQNLRIPIQLKLKTSEIGYLTYFGAFGADVGFRLKAKSDDTGNYGSGAPLTDENVDLGTEVSFMNVGLNVGAGVEYGLTSNTSLVVSLNYHNGFSNSLKKKSALLENNAGTALIQKAYMRFIALNIGVMF